MNRNIKFGLLIVPLALGLTACQGDTSSNQTRAQSATQQAGQDLNVGGDYPQGQIKYPTAEQRGDRERLLRFANPYKIGYLTVISQSGQVLLTYTIMGKPSSTGSQLLNTQDTTKCNSGTSCSVVDSLGDDGTWGGEECDKSGGVFFFDTNKGMHEICPGSAVVVYSDVPQTISSKPVLSIQAGARPTDDKGQLTGTLPTPRATPTK